MISCEVKRKKCAQQMPQHQCNTTPRLRSQAPGKLVCKYTFCFVLFGGAGEVAQWLGTPATLAEGQSWVARPHTRQVISALKTNSGGSDSSSGPLGMPTQVAFTHKVTEHTYM